MGILYHDNTVYPQYADGKLLDNWNPNADYGNEYADVHFRIHTPSYKPPSFHFAEEDRIRFYQDTGRIFKALGWEPMQGQWSCCGGCMKIRKGKANLYLHPQDFSGEVMKSEIKTVAEALSTGTEFSLGWVDVYETAYDITDEEYYRQLRGQYERIKELLLTQARTTRSTLFFRDEEIARQIAQKVRLRRVGDDDGRYSGGGKTEGFLLGVITQLIDEGYLVPAKKNGSRYIRTINKTEQRRKGLKIA